MAIALTFLAVLAGLFAWWNHRTGKAVFGRLASVDRAEHPAWFWFVQSLYAAAMLACTGAAMLAWMGVTEMR